MQRVVVLGCSGSGKSTLARRIGASRGLRVIHLDQEFWQPGWTEPSTAAWHARVAALAAEPRWVMEGNYHGTLHLRLPRADTVIVVQAPRWLRMVRVIRRSLLSYGRVRADAAPGCPERFDWEFLKFVWRQEKATMPRALAALEGFGGEVITLRRRRDIAGFG